MGSAIEKGCTGLSGCGLSRIYAVGTAKAQPGKAATKSPISSPELRRKPASTEFSVGLRGGHGQAQHRLIMIDLMPDPILEVSVTRGAERCGRLCPPDRERNRDRQSPPAREMPRDERKKRIEETSGGAERSDDFRGVPQLEPNGSGMPPMQRARSSTPHRRRAAVRGWSE